MHPYLVQAVAAERVADMRRDAAANRRVHDREATASSAGNPRARKPEAGNPSPAPQHSPAPRSGQLPAPRWTPVPSQPSGRVAQPAPRQHSGTARTGADDVLVGPGGASDGAESAALCTAGC